jgi:hypothetical protein
MRCECKIRTFFVNEILILRWMENFALFSNEFFVRVSLTEAVAVVSQRILLALWSIEFLGIFLFEDFFFFSLETFFFHFALNGRFHFLSEKHKTLYRC